MTFADGLFAVLVDCALAGATCPTDDHLAAQLGVDRGRISPALTELVSDGLIARETRGWSRIITILRGPAAGSVTAPRTKKTDDFPERVIDWPHRQRLRLPRNCFASHNLSFKPSAGRLSGSTPTATLAGVSSAWAVR
jgi:DNA-binding transcriptional MocR family regulator